METKTIVYEYTELPENIKELLQMYYNGTDTKISNGTYTRYPYLFDFEPNEELDELEKWFLNNGALGYDFIIIDWSW